MRILKSLLIAVALVAALFAGFFVVAIVAVAAAIFLLARRLLRPKTPRAAAPAQHGPVPRASTEAIDIVATEIPSDSPPPR